MKFFRTLNIKRDSKSIAVLSILTAFVILLEVFPVVGLTDLKFNAGGTPFTLDWTGIPLLIIFLAYGFLYSLFSILAMFIAIAYRNPIGAIFKLVAEVITMIGVSAGYLLSLKVHAKGTRRAIILLLFGIVFRAIGMYFLNILLLPLLLPYTIEAAIAASTALVPWNMVQAAINVFGGVILFDRIPSSLANEADFMTFSSSTDNGVMELSNEDLTSRGPTSGSDLDED